MLMTVVVKCRPLSAQLRVLPSKVQSGRALQTLPGKASHSSNAVEGCSVGVEVVSTRLHVLH